jgi:hypothetical protein
MGCIGGKVFPQLAQKAPPPVFAPHDGQKATISPDCHFPYLIEFEFELPVTTLFRNPVSVP